MRVWGAVVVVEVPEAESTEVPEPVEGPTPWDTLPPEVLMADVDPPSLTPLDFVDCDFPSR
jgi:hypothetical protein